MLLPLLVLISTVVENYGYFWVGWRIGIAVDFFKDMVGECFFFRDGSISLWCCKREENESTGDYSDYVLHVGCFLFLSGGCIEEQ